MGRIGIQSCVDLGNVELVERADCQALSSIPLPALEERHETSQCRLDDRSTSVGRGKSSLCVSVLDRTKARRGETLGNSLEINVDLRLGPGLDAAALYML